MRGGASRGRARKGYLCLESEGSEVHFRKVQIMELPSGRAEDLIGQQPLRLFVQFCVAIPTPVAQCGR